MKKIFVLTLALITFQLIGAQTIPLDPDVKYGKLDNGLTYYVRHNEEPKGLAHFYIAQKVGSVLEEDNQRGLAHFLEHMCFNGTENFPGNSLIKYLESIGVKFGADLNAYTSIDETVYNIDKVPVSVPGAIDSCLLILHDWADGLLLTAEDIDSERGVIHEEWRSRRNAQSRLYEELLPKIYPDGNRYGLRMPIGIMEVVDNFPYEDLRNYYEKWYRPDQQGIIVVGDIDTDEIVAKIKDIFGAIKMPENAAERVYFEIPDNKEPIIAMAKDKEQQYALSFIFKKHEAYPTEKKEELDYLVTHFIDGAVSIMAAQRIQEMMMKPDCPFTQAQIGDDDFFLSKTKGAFTGVAVTSEEGLEEGVAAVYREMLRIVRGGFTEGELRRATAEIMSSLESAYNEREKTKSVSYCKEYVRHFIDNEPVPGIETEYALAKQLVEHLSLDMVNTYASSLMEPDNLVVVSMLPDKEGVTYPDEARMAEVMKSVENEDIEPYEDKSSSEPLMAEIPAPGKVKKSKPAQFGYTKLELSNGVNVYYLKTDFKADQILINAFSYGGTSLYSDDEIINLKGIDLFTVGGVGNMNETELSKALAGKRVKVNPSIGTYSESLEGSSTPKDFETMLQLTNLYFTSQRRDDSAFEAYTTKMKTMLKNQELNPTSALKDTIVSVLYNNKPRAKSLKADDIDKIDYQRVMDIASERFSNAADFNFVFTGNFDEETMIPMIETYLGSLPTGGKKEKFKDVKMDPAKGINTCVFDKQMQTPIAIVTMLDSGKGKFSVKNNQLVDIAGQALRIIFTEEIREKEGGTYGVSVNTSLSRIPKPKINIQISYQTDPDKYEYLNEKIRALLEDFAENGPSEEILTKVKEYKIKTFNENLKSNSYYSGILQRYIQSGIDYKKDYLEILDSITSKDVAKVVADLLKQGNSSEIVMIGKTE